MKSKQLFFNAALMAVTASILFVACSKSTSTDVNAPAATQQSVSLFLTDGPGVFNNVYFYNMVNYFHLFMMQVRYIFGIIAATHA